MFCKNAAYQVATSGCAPAVLARAPATKPVIDAPASEPNHKDGTIHKTKAEAESDEDEHFDGEMSE